MNKFIKNNFNKIICIFILLQPILDLLTGICLNVLHTSFTIGIFIRVLFLLFIMYSATFIYKSKRSIMYYLLVGIYFIFFMLGFFIYKDANLFQEIQGLLKAFYFPIILLSLYELRSNIKISNYLLYCTLLFYLLGILIPNVLNIGFDTYLYSKVGNLGFYNSANEISGILSILTPILLIIINDSKCILKKALLAIIYLIVILGIGTKTPLLSLGITALSVFIFLINKYIKAKKYKNIYYLLGTVLVAGCSFLLIIPRTNFYKNIQIHLNYLGVDNITDVFKDADLVDHFIFSERLTFLKRRSSLYRNSSNYEKLFGIGYYNDKPTKLIEMDYFDIYYSHGLIGFIILFGANLYVLEEVLLRKSKYNFERVMKLTAIFLIVLLSFFTGHIITTPSVSLIAIMIILSLNKSSKNNLLFTAVNLDMGGIENALINLVNRINYKKYKVDIILEEKKGVLLPKLNNKVNVSELKVSNNSSFIIRKTLNFTRKFMFKIENYHMYNFSCCYATYSLSANKLAYFASNNNSIYIHSNYLNIYKKKDDLEDFFNERHMDRFKHIFAVSNEATKAPLTLYKNVKNKVLVFNNFINVEEIIKKSNESIEETPNKNHKLLVFVGRLEDHSKKVSRQFNLVKNIKDLDLWIIGDGPDKDKYVKEVEKLKIKDKVTFLGRKLNPYPYMKKGDYIILTSDYEGFPVTYLESMALKKSIITTIDVSDENIDMKDYAYIISKDKDKMVEEVKEILKSTKKPKQADIEKLQEKRMKSLEKIFDEVN